MKTHHLAVVCAKLQDPKLGVTSAAGVLANGSRLECSVFPEVKEQGGTRLCLTLDSTFVELKYMT